MRGFEFEPAASVEYFTAIDSIIAEYGESVALAFIERFENALRRLCVFPESAPVIDAPYRYCSLTRFPYGIVYRFDDSTVFIVAVTYERRLPEYWKDRLKKEK
jgi:plasmid stabilization system protein ParE